MSADPRGEALTAADMTPAEAAAWEVAVDRGLAITRADLRAVLTAVRPGGATVNAGYDPVPDLAALIDGLGNTLTAGTDEGIRAGLADLLKPYARVRGGLLLDFENHGQATSWALAEALNRQTRD